jgi:hypothetical protein
VKRVVTGYDVANIVPAPSFLDGLPGGVRIPPWPDRQVFVRSDGDSVSCDLDKLRHSATIR